MNKELKQQVIFVGVHNKPGMKPLDSQTRSGKIIDKIISHLPTTLKCVKSNLYDLEYLPSIAGWEDVVHWSIRVSNCQDDIIVLLGDCVRMRFGKWFENQCKIICIGHPAKRMSTEKLSEYIDSAVKQILAS